jgi:hypothetical protein
VTINTLHVHFILITLRRQRGKERRRKNRKKETKRKKSAVAGFSFQRSYIIFFCFELQLRFYNFRIQELLSAVLTFTS